MKLTSAAVVVAACASGALAASTPPMDGTNPCTNGPSFWCASAANAAKCDFDVADCKKYCDNAEEYPDIQDGDICSPPGSNKCTQGPDYFCASKANAKKCGIKASECKKYCNKDYADVLKGDICTPKPKPVGSNKCTQGPSYFCASAANAKECDMKASDCKKYCNDEYPDVQKGPLCKLTKPMVGNNKCTQGPSYFCASAANAKECGMKASDCKKYCNDEYPDVLKGALCAKPKSTRDAEDLPGSNKCTWGPSYWCASKANAKECDFDPKECKKYCDNAKEYPDIQDGDICKPVVGSEACTQGPSYFCASAANAKECGMKASDCKKYCNKDYPNVLKGNICKP